MQTFGHYYIYWVILYLKEVKEMDIAENDIVVVHILKKEMVSGFGIAKGARSFDRDLDRDDIRELGV